MRGEARPPAPLTSQGLPCRSPWSLSDGPFPFFVTLRPLCPGPVSKPSSPEGDVDLNSVRRVEHSHPGMRFARNATTPIAAWSDNRKIARIRSERCSAAGPEREPAFRSAPAPHERRGPGPPVGWPGPRWQHGFGKRARALPLRRCGCASKARPSYCHLHMVLAIGPPPFRGTETVAAIAGTRQVRRFRARPGNRGRTARARCRAR
jgi:hypothetical protein